MEAISTPVSPMMQDKLTNEIFSILENKFLYGKPTFNINTTATNAAVNSAGKVRILSIDSGDAILAATTLLHLQSILRAKSGNDTAHIADYFDVVAGSGAGGVLAGLLFTRGKDGSPVFTAEQSLEFLLDHHLTLNRLTAGVFSRSSRAGKVLKKVFGDATLKDTMKAVLIPCYDITTGATFLFSRADALEMDSCDFSITGLCEATLADRPVHLKSTDGITKILAVGGRVGMSNPTASAITHVLNNKQEFPLCNGLGDLLVVSLGNGESNYSASAFAKIAADNAADMVDQAVSMAFGEWRSNYVRIQGNGRSGNSNYNNINKKENKKALMVRKMEEILGEKNVESVLFKGKKLVEFTNMEKVEIIGGEIIKEQERRKNAILPTVVLKNSNSSSNSNNSPRSSSATTLSLSSN